MKNFSLTAFLFLGCSHSLFAQVLAPNPSQVSIERITYSGPGCAAGTVAKNISQDLKAFTLVFSDFVAEVGPGTPPGKNKTSCKVTVDLKYPAGWSYTILSVDYAGFFNLEKGVVATQVAKYYFQSTNQFKTFKSTFTGPLTDDYAVGDQIGDGFYSPCRQTRPVVIDTEIEVNNTANPNASGFITTDSIDGAVKHIYGIQWIRC